MTMGEHIKNIISDRGMTQKQLAGELRLHQGTLSGYLRDQRQMPYSILVDLCRTLDVSADFLLGLTDARESPQVLSAEERRYLEDRRCLTPEQQELIDVQIGKMKEQNRRQQRMPGSM